MDIRNQNRTPTPVVQNARYNNGLMVQSAKTVRADVEYAYPPVPVRSVRVPTKCPVLTRVTSVMLSVLLAQGVLIHSVSHVKALTS